MQATDEHHRQKRSHLKVRTGCATCKTRRVKCDEARPECGRCRTANRKCVYAIPKTWLFIPRKTETSASPPTPSALPISSSQDSSQEQRAFQFFREKTAPQFAGQHELAQRFWCNFIVCRATEDPLLHKLAVAMGARHEATVLGSQESSALATTCHTSVMSSLARNLTQMRVDLSLLCCAMLMGYANLCEEVPATAAIHFGLGLKILREETIPGPRGAADCMGEYIDPMFTELELATTIFRVPPVHIELIFSETLGPPLKPILPLSFTTLYEAKTSLANIHRWMLYSTLSRTPTSNGFQNVPLQVDELLARWRQLLIVYAGTVAHNDVSTFIKARKMLFQYKLFVTCRAAARSVIFSSVSRIQMVSVDFSQPNLTSILCNLTSNALDHSAWSPLAKTNDRERDDLDIWPQGEPAGQDGGVHFFRITLGG